MKACLLSALAGAALLLAGCSSNPLLVQRSACPAVAIPDHVGSVTRFAPGAPQVAQSITLTAEIVDLDHACTEDADTIATSVRYTVAGQRRAATAAEDVTLPLFVAVVRGGNTLVSKRTLSVRLHFPAGSLTGEARGTADARIHRGAATLPADVEQAITRKRRPEDPDALIDPMASVKVQKAVRDASFEVLVGFQLDDAAVAYNIAY